MIQTRCQDLNTKLDHISNLKNYQSELEKFQKRQQQLDEISKELFPCIEAINALRFEDSNELDFVDKVSPLLMEINKMIENFRQNKGWLIEEFNAKILKNQTKKLKETIDIQLTKAWNNYKTTNLRKGNDELLNLLGKIGVEDYQNTVSIIKQKLQVINSVTFPKNQKHFHLLKRDIQDISDAFDQLESKNIPTSVLDFFKATSKHGASLDSLTPEVMGWLKNEGITSLFQIKLTN
jgi:hypothetical protein